MSAGSQFLGLMALIEKSVFYIGIFLCWQQPRYTVASIEDGAHHKHESTQLCMRQFGGQEISHQFHRKAGRSIKVISI